LCGKAISERFNAARDFIRLEENAQRRLSLG
jgi:hypothetical protein